VKKARTGVRKKLDVAPINSEEEGKGLFKSIEKVGTVTGWGVGLI
jgi:hypothetical protein